MRGKIESVVSEIINDPNTDLIWEAGFREPKDFFDEISDSELFLEATKEDESDRPLQILREVLEEKWVAKELERSIDSYIDGERQAEWERIERRFRP